jgi:flavin reductase (DIM6/NTAB) family NADH-FMN oxidoreductase RutF
MKPDIQSADVRTEALRLLSNGLYVLTTCSQEAIHAATVSWITQVSFQPPLVLLALRRNSHLAHAVRKGRRFAINVLADDQQAIAETFFSHRTDASQAEGMEGYTFRMATSHCPLLTDALAWIECRLADEPPSPGDHALMLGEITGAGIRREGAPMTLWSTPWSYGGIREP